MIFKAKPASGPYIAWMIIFIIVPLLLVVFFAFTDSDNNFTVANIIKVGEFAPVFIRSIILGVYATVICLVMAYPLSFFMSRMNARNQRLFVMLIMLPMWINFLLRTYAWMAILEINGILNSFLGNFGIGPFEMINTQGAVVLGMVYNYLPFMILPLYTVLIKIDNSIIEAAQDLGAGILKVFVKIIIPLSMPGVSSGIAMVFVPSVSTFIISRMLGGGSNMLIGDLIDQQFLGNAYNPNLGSAISLVLMLFILLSMALLNQFDDDETGDKLI